MLSKKQLTTLELKKKKKKLKNGGREENINQLK